jgi:hypothetical protein
VIRVFALQSPKERGLATTCSSDDEAPMIVPGRDCLVVIRFVEGFLEKRVGLRLLSAERKS